MKEQRKKIVVDGKKVGAIRIPILHIQLHLL